MVRAVEIVEPSGIVARRKPVLGDMGWDGKVWRRWTGRRWASAAYSLHKDRLTLSTPFDHYPQVDQEARRVAVAKAVEHQVATNGASVVFAGPSGTVLGYRRKVSHGLHAILTFFTGGLWALVWIAVTLGRGEERVQLEADRWGNVWAKRVVGT
jgi:hypothetical protein